MYKVIGSTKSRAFRVMWMLEEMGEEYQQVDAGPRSETAMKYNPLGKIPALVDGDDVLTDSVAIMTYLGDRHGKLTAPAGSPARARQDAMTFWLIDEFDAILWAAAKHSFVFPEDRRVPEIKDSLKAELLRSADGCFRGGARTGGRFRWRAVRRQSERSSCQPGPNFSSARAQAQMLP